MGDTLILPDHAADEYVDGLDYDIWVAKAFNDMLRQLDPHLRCFFARPNSTSFEHPGRWHIARLHPSGNDELNQYFVVQTPEGEYTTPQQYHFDRLVERDVGRDAKRAYEKMQNARNERQAKRLKNFEDKRREFRELLEERLAHVYGTRIAVTGGMKERAGGRQLLDAKGNPIALSQDRPREDALADKLDGPKPAITVERELLMPGDKITAAARELAITDTADQIAEGA